MTRFVLACRLISKLLHISQDIMSNKKSGHLFFKKSFVEICGEMEPANPLDKYAVAVKKNNAVVGHLPLQCSSKFAETMNGVNAK